MKCLGQAGWEEEEARGKQGELLNSEAGWEGVVTGLNLSGDLA